MRPGLLSDLIHVGYEIFLEGDNIRYRYLKPGNPPDAVRPLIDELRKHKAQAINVLKSVTVKPFAKSQSVENREASWKSEDKTLIDWFLTMNPPMEPFHLEPHRRIVNPSKFFAALQKDIEAGPNGPRGRYGALIQDLIAMKKVLH